MTLSKWRGDPDLSRGRRLLSRVGTSLVERETSPVERERLLSRVVLLCLRERRLLSRVGYFVSRVSKTSVGATPAIGAAILSFFFYGPRPSVGPGHGGWTVGT